MATVQQVIDVARIPLNDSAKTRWPDGTLLTHFNQCINLLRGRRPDLFIGNWTAPANGYALSDTFPLDVQYQQPVADYVSARAFSADDEVALKKTSEFFALSVGSL